MTAFRPPLALDLHREPLLAILRAVIAAPTLSAADLHQLLRQHLKVTPEGRRFFAKDELIAAYRAFTASGELPPFEPAVLERLRLKPVRTTSGVAVITVLTKPFPCPGECIFCPNDVRMPKSYLRDEPGAQRAALNAFDPYLQTYTRLRALHNMGHPTDKIELIVLGGTWSFYPEHYQIWFIKRLFDALHDFGRGVDRTEEVRALLEADTTLRSSSRAPSRLTRLFTARTWRARTISWSRRCTPPSCSAVGKRQRSPTCARQSQNMPRGKSWKRHIAKMSARRAVASAWWSRRALITSRLRKCCAYGAWAAPKSRSAFRALMIAFCS
jgi:hypothetical protein